MSAKYIFRLDDICPDMNYANFCRIRDIFFKYNIKPIIGVIPHNEDQELKRKTAGLGILEEQFWEEILELQNKHGWSVSLHGYNHVYTSKNGGMFKRNKYAEFAGIPYKSQYEKIKKGKKILEEHGLKIESFMAPAHSLDWNTVEALKKNNITVITDGRGRFPYKKRGMLFIPQETSWPKMHRVGYDTVCFHINSWTEEMFRRFEKIPLKGYNCIEFMDAVRIKECDKFTYKTKTDFYYAISCMESMIRKPLSWLKHSVFRL